MALLATVRLREESAVAEETQSERVREQRKESARAEGPELCKLPLTVESSLGID